MAARNHRRDPTRNQALSERRAASVAAALQALGVPAEQLTSRGFGESQLITDNNGVEIPDLSRRVVFAVRPDGDRVISTPTVLRSPGRFNGRRGTGIEGSCRVGSVD